jgi:hypothetical protein
MQPRRPDFSEVDRRSARSRATRWAVAAFLLAVVTSLVMFLAPLETEVEVTGGGGPPAGAPPSQLERKVTHSSLLQVQGWSVALPLSVPVVLTGAGVLAARRRWRSALVLVAVVLGAGVVVAAASVGFFYLPAEGASIVAAVKAGEL